MQLIRSTGYRTEATPVQCKANLRLILKSELNDVLITQPSR